MIMTDTSEMLFSSPVQTADWIYQERETGYLGYAGVVVRQLLLPGHHVAVNTVFWMCPHVHQSHTAAVACSALRIKQIISKIK